MLTSQDLLGRGWTKRAIGKWLSQPDRIEEFPSHGRWSRTRHWYDEARVEAVEATADWQAFAEKRADRSAAAKKAATTRHANTVAWADQVEIRIDIDDFDWTELEALALDAKSAWECERGRTGDVHGAPEHVKHRWTMNYIRHELTNYEEILASLRGATGGSDAYDTIRARIEGRIEAEILAMKAALIVPVIQWPAEWNPAEGWPTAPVLEDASVRLGKPKKAGAR